MTFNAVTASKAQLDARVPDDKSRRDYAVLYNSLLPLADFGALLSAAAVALLIHNFLFTPLTRSDFLWNGQFTLLATALLGAVLLYDKRFVSVASRWQTGALVRCYITSFVMFAGAVGLIAWTSGILTAVPSTLIAAWLTASLVLTALVRMSMATAVRFCVRKGLLVETIAIVGAGPRAERLLRYLREATPMRPELLGVFDDETTPSLGVVESDGQIAMPAATVSGNIDALIALGKVRRIDWIFLASHAGEDRLLSVVHRLKTLSVPIAMCPTNLEPGTPCNAIGYIGDSIPVTLLPSSPGGWRANLGTIGQFVPRWIITLLRMVAILAHAAWSRLPSLRSRLKSTDARELVCELDNYDLEGFAAVANDFGQQRFGYVVTPNVDHFIRLHDDPAFRSLYATAEYVLMDSRFLAQLLRVTGRVKLQVCTGSDLAERLLTGMAGSADRLVIIGGTDQQVHELSQRFALQNLAHYNPPMGFIRDPAAVAACAEFIEAHSPFRFCLLAVGTPQQEILAQHLHTRGIARGLMLCCGASINFMTGVERRAPQWLQRIGFEWLFRLLQSPRRLASRYLVRGPRIFGLLRNMRFKVRLRTVTSTTVTAQAA